MESSFITASPSATFFVSPSNLNPSLKPSRLSSPSQTFHFSPKPSKLIRVSTILNPNYPKPHTSPLIRAGAGALVLTAALLVGKFSAKAEPPPPPPSVEESLEIETSSDAINEDLKALVLKKLKDGEDSEALRVLKRLVSSQPSELEWKFLMARLLNETGEVEESRKVFEAILESNPLSFEALFENSLLMDRCGEGEAVLERLEQALRLAETVEKDTETRDVRLIMAQILFLKKNVDDALKSYEELAMEDPKDYRPYFCRGVIYNLLDRNREAREEFAKYHELAPKKFEIDGYLQTPLSRVNVFGTDSSEN